MEEGSGLYKVAVRHPDFGKAIVFYYRTQSGTIYRWMNQVDPADRCQVRWQREQTMTPDFACHSPVQSCKLEFLVLKGCNWKQAIGSLKWAMVVESFRSSQ